MKPAKANARGEKYRSIMGSFKRTISSGIVAYKYFRFRNLFDTTPCNVERHLILPLVYFLSHSRVSVVYDVGAADGRFASAVAKLRNVRHVVSLEPIPASFHRLQRRTSRSKKVTTLNIAAGDHAGSVNFFVTADRDSSSRFSPSQAHSDNFPGCEVSSTTTVDSITLDEVRSQNSLPLPDVIKIDTQGGELAVLLGAKECLREAAFCIVECSFVELYGGAPLIGEIVQHMATIGWSIVGCCSQSTNRLGKPLQVDVVFGRKDPK